MGKQINRIRKNKIALNNIKQKQKCNKYLTSVATIMFKDGEKEKKEDRILYDLYYYKE
ncbi:cyclohexyl-isocyanide hydratase [Clostridium botulinum B str. Osaka05]|uniref:Cyclohexyl-isocyanide hydratase n=1 Tax=Clostridium botulinum B str. Osaka05 TaxID=1407017 RepID=A0A060N5F8_CLOBO|nr:hypothetical protein [Clostridium botulinum]BAO04780.1 cyclohexyl-isocyanide hydratase [Clostridium botulinum B str. Osaka05]